MFPVFGHPAWGIAVDDASNVIFADIFHANGTVWKLTSKGRLESILTNFHAHNVNIDKYGDIWVAHGEKPYRLVKIPSGARPHRILLRTQDEKLFFGGNAAVSRDGLVYFGIGNYIWKFSGGEAVKFNKHRLEWNQAIFIDDDGDIYAPDIGVGNGTVFKLRKDGTFKKVADNLISKLDRPKDRHNDVLLGMTKDEDNNFYIAETAGRRIIKIDPKGKVETFYAAETGWKPTAITFGGDTAYIYEYGRIGTDYDFRLMKIDVGGAKTELVKHSEYLAGNSATAQLGCRF